MTRTITNSAACVLVANLMLCASVFAAHHSYAQLYDETRVANNGSVYGVTGRTVGMSDK